jgi:membrane fusion protein (multidrug efflux system)
MPIRIPKIQLPQIKLPIRGSNTPQKKSPRTFIIILVLIAVAGIGGLFLSDMGTQKPKEAVSAKEAAPGPSFFEGAKEFFGSWFGQKKPEEKTAGLSQETQMPMEAMGGMGVAIPVRTYKVQKTDFKDELPLMGTVRGTKQVPLFFEINGVIEKLNYLEGDFVKKGDAVATLADKDYRLRVEYATAKKNTAEKEALVAKKRMENYQRLYEAGAVIKPKYEEMALAYDVARSNVESAQKEVEVAAKELEKTKLLAPVDGVMGRWDVENGQFVTSNTKLATIADIANVWVEVGIIEKDMPKVAFGQKAAVSVDAFPEKEFLGEIDSLSPMLDQKTRMLSCRIKVENKDNLLLPGMFAKARLFVYEKKDALVVPSSALQDLNKDNTFDAVYVVENGVANTRPIMLDYITTDYAVVSQGVKEQDEVVVESQATLKEGQPVEVIEAQEKPTVE